MRESTTDWNASILLAMSAREREKASAISSFERRVACSRFTVQIIAEKLSPIVFMNSRWKLFLAFYLPAHFACGSFYMAGAVLNGMEDCRSYCYFSFECAERNTLFLHDFFAYAGIALIILSIVLPLIISYHGEKIFQIKLFE